MVRATVKSIQTLACYVISAVWSVNKILVFLSPGLSQPVPLVPLSEADEDAMENKSFRKLLRKLGIRPPANEQVCFCFVF